MHTLQVLLRGLPTVILTGTGDKTWRRYACVNSDLVDSKFCNRVNINVRFLDVFFAEFR